MLLYNLVLAWQFSRLPARPYYMYNVLKKNEKCKKQMLCYMVLSVRYEYTTIDIVRDNVLG